MEGRTDPQCARRQAGVTGNTHLGSLNEARRSQPRKNPCARSRAAETKERGMSNQERAPDIDKKRPAGGTTGQSNRGDLSGSSFTENSPGRQSENGVVAKMRWLDRVVIDATLPPNATRVAYAISAHVNARSGIAWPSVERLADLLELNPRSVRRCIGALVGGGYLAVEFGGGSVSNKYSLLHDDGHVEMVNRATDADRCVAPLTEMSGDDETTPDKIVCTPGQNCPGTPDRIVRGPLALPPYEPSDNNPLKEPSEGTLSIDRGAAIIRIDRGEGRFKRTRRGGEQLSIPVEVVESRVEPNGFREFWFAYPLKNGRFEAAEAFREALKHADAEVIVAGARRYDRWLQTAKPDPVERATFTKHAKNWLRCRHWTDEYAAPRPPGIGRAMAVAARMIAEMDQ